MFLFLLVNFTFPLFQNTNSIPYELIEWEKDSVHLVLPSLSSTAISPPETKIQPSYFYFDPNVLGKEGWLRLGLSEKKAQVILNYVQKGGRFYKKEDLAKIYSLSRQEVDRLMPYVQLEEVAIRVSNTPIPTKETFIHHAEKKITLDINLADSSQFETLRGIGPAYARRIVNFREALGGYHDIQQLKEVYGIPKELIDYLASQLFAHADAIRKIAINSCNVEELAKHPYVKYKRAKLIIAYRNQHGSFESTDDMKHIHSLDDEFFIKIEPYLDFTLKQ